MSTTPAPDGTQWFLHTWQDHILEPVETALDVLAREQTELAAEREALDDFLTRLDRIEPVEQRTVPVGSPSESAGTAPIEGLREAYSETVLSVEHFETVYDETLVENVAVEFGPDYAAVFHPDSNVHFSPPIKRSLVAATEQAIDERESLERAVKLEQRAISSYREQIQSLLDTLDSTVVPEWYRETFHENVAAILSDRQEELHSSVHRFDTLDFCSYMYEDQLWTHPVLTSVARLQESVDS
ncbi:DUF7260 family protein [Haloarcula salina]|uniref:DUF7260 domain-containing protein n=1 Tax=Haloarcula salina TaxID=1429914 RepID=A0AA41FZ68_9EURY|nr:hypothetical protein [Haloarcula salina]MBV0901311.1 hypothetical protein [Haloarcula salina]